jgi:hypothetical protein
MKRALALATLVVLLLPVALAAKDSRDSRDSGNSLVGFEGGIGVHPVSNVAGTANADGTFPNVTRNIVRGVNPPGQIWVIADLSADVKTDGRIKVDGRGLLLAGGDNIGTNGNQKVFATLICEAVAPFTLRNTNTAGVALAPDGDFRIDDVLSPAPPATCASPVLLIRNTGGAWFAAGIQKLDNDN